MIGRALGLALPAVIWLLPPPVLPIPSRTGPEGPPRPFGAAPALGKPPPATADGLAKAQSRALLAGPFPHGGLARGVSDGGLLLDSSAQVREVALERIRASGATVARIPVNWSSVAAARRTPGLDARDPASALYHFERIDASVRSTVAAGLSPLLVVSHAPAFAEAPARWTFAYPGSWAPSPLALEEFAAALARRYDGTFPDPLRPGRSLPAVRMFQAWNEPNLARYLEPQWIASDGRWRAFSPALYREMLNGFYAGVKSVAPRALVLAAGLAPNGEGVGVGRMAPVPFLRGLLCLTPSGRHPRGGCGEPAHLDVLAFHPLSVGDPDLPASSSLDVSIADAAKVSGLLRRAIRLHTVLPGGAKPLWVTELNWESAPQNPHGVPERLQAAWVARALHRLWIARVTFVDWEFLVDPYPGVLANTPTGRTVEYARPAGLYSAGPGGDLQGARPKPFLSGFSFPFDPLRAGPRKVRVWALTMAPAQDVALQRSGRGGAWSTLARLRSDRHGVLNALLALRGAATLRLQSGALTSASAHVPARHVRSELQPRGSRHCGPAVC